MVTFHRLLFGLVLALVLLASLAGCKSGGQREAASVVRTNDGRSLLESRESPYNNIYVYQSGTNISMAFGLNKNIYTESVYNTADERELPVPYTQFMTSSLIYPSKIKSILEIGFGGGRTAWYLHRSLPGVQVTAVEIDPAVVELAHKYFGIKDEENFHVVSRDGRIFLADSKSKYDIILIDAYRGPFVPFHLLTKEFYELVREHLEPGGVIAQNVEPTTMLFDSAVNTLHSVFPTVEFYDASGTDTGGNVVMVAYNRQAFSSSDLVNMSDSQQSVLRMRYDLRKMLKHRFELKTVVIDQKTYLNIVNQLGQETAGVDENAKVLTDDFAPVESLKAIARHNEKWKN